nr:MAG TPA: hypothetical protein [Caudoviricetes sp.]
MNTQTFLNSGYTGQRKSHYLLIKLNISLYLLEQIREDLLR